MGGNSTADDCNEYICSNDKDEKQMKEVMNRPLGESSKGSLSHSEFKERPLNAIDLGRSTWPILHRFTLGYPDSPKPHHQAKALAFLTAFSKLYPCKVCASDF